MRQFLLKNSNGYAVGVCSSCAISAVRRLRIAATVALLAAAIATGACGKDQDAPAPPEGTIPATVERVVDGDTVKVVLQDETTERIRLIGIDTPESVHPDASKNVPYGQVASDYTKSRLDGQTIGLELDVEERDQYDRLLAYVWLGDELINLTLVREGHAVVSTYPPNVKYVDLFTAAQTEAREAGLGLWAEEKGD